MDFVVKRRKSEKYCSPACYWKSLEGKPSWNRGKSPSIEQRKKMSEAKIGKIPWNKGLVGFLEGERSGLWKGGITPENKKIRASLEYKMWRQTIFERDDYMCLTCGQYGKSLEVHHIRNFSEFSDIRLDTNNGITLCKQCHKKYHAKYGVRNNNFLQLIEFEKDVLKAISKNAAGDVISVSAWSEV
jgi:hypothetical protein